MTTGADLQAILSAELKRFLDADLDRRMSRAPYTAVYANWWEPGDKKTAEEADLEVIRSARESLQHELKMNSPDDLMMVAARRLLQNHNLPEELLGRLVYGLQERAIKGWDIVERRTIGTEPLVWSDAPPALLPPPAAPPLATPAKPALALASTFKVAFGAWGSASAGWRPGPHRQAMVSFTLFLEIVGDKPIDQFTPQDGDLFRTTLRKIPANYRKSATEKGKPIGAIIADAPPGAQPLADKTIKRHFWAASQFFQFLTETGALDRTHSNPMRGFTFNTRGPARGQRDMWTGEELKALFSSPIWTGCHPFYRARPGDQIVRDAMFWLPLLGAFHGNRLEEFAQLRRKDVAQEHGIWFLNITDDDDLNLKNQQSRRKVPLHSELIRVGFLQYVEGIAPAPKDSIFPDLKPGGPDKKFGYTISKRFTAYRRAIGVYRKGMDYHSFRHGVTTKLYEMEVNEGWIDLLTGHEEGGESRRRYLKGVPLPKLKEAIDKVAWPEVDLSGLYVPPKA